jgi:diguanylate cyclase (GGDEF)-like protein
VSQGNSNIEILRGEAPLRRLREPARLLLMCILVWGGSWASTQLSLAVHTVSCIWISNGITAAFILTTPARWRLPLFLAAMTTNIGADLASGNTLPRATWFLLCNAIEVAVTVWALRHFGTRARIISKQALLRIGLFGVILGPLICGVLAAPVVSTIDSRSYVEAVRIWFLSDALGCAATLPALLLIMAQDKPNSRHLIASLSDIVWAALLMAVVVVVFWQTRYPLVFLLFPPLAVALFRFRIAGAIYGASIVVIVAAAFTAEGHGPFVLLQQTSPAERVFLFQAFGLTIFGSCVPLGYLIEQRHRLEASLRRTNRKLENLALLDPLTGVRNRRSFDAKMEVEWKRAAASERALSFIYLDIDFFKLFNDAYGHQEGDECLRSVAGILTRGVRSSVDFVARYGGEEFVILLPATSSNAAQETARRIVKAIEDSKIPHRESPFGVVTASFGVATVRPTMNGSPYELIRMADHALYNAKRSGRARIETALTSELELSPP